MQSGAALLGKHEKLLIFLFVLMTGVCVGLVAIYFTNEANAPTKDEGVQFFSSNLITQLQHCPFYLVIEV